jgi:hypothetical protein
LLGLVAPRQVDLGDGLLRQAMRLPAYLTLKVEVLILVRLRAAVLAEGKLYGDLIIGHPVHQTVTFKTV